VASLHSGVKTHASNGIRNWMTTRPWGALLALLLPCWAGGCATSPEPVPYEIVAVEFEGVERFGHDELLGFLHLGQNSWVPFSPEYTFDEALIAVDIDRVEALYRAHGYYHARVVDVAIQRDDGSQEVRVRLKVDEGTPVRIRRVVFNWADGAADSGLDTAALETGVGLVSGEVLETARFNDALGTLRFTLLGAGHPLARVAGGVEVYEESGLADVELTVEPGPAATVGRVGFVGLDEVPEYLVEREVRFAVGLPWSPGLMRQIEAALGGMRVFRWVAVDAPTEVIDGQVDVVARVSEAAPQSVRLGLAASFEAVRWQQEGQLNTTHTNLFGHLTRLDLGLRGGWAELPDPLNSDAHGPVVGVVPTFSKKGLLEDQLVWSLQPAYGVNILDGYQYHSPSNRIGVSRWFGTTFRADVSHNLRYVDFFNVSPLLDANASLLGRDFRDPFGLSYLDVQLELYATDGPLEMADGAVFDLTYDLAGGPLFGDYSFQRLLGGMRAYWTPWSRLQIATRLQGGMIVPYGSEGGAPLNFKFYLGGANSVRGWGSRRLSPQLLECADGETTCAGIPVGGFTMVQGNLELRLALFGGLTLVGFADMGDVQADALTWKVDAWNYAAGPGLRFDSPVGLFRLDVGFRLNTSETLPDEPSWAMYFGLGETF